MRSYYKMSLVGHSLVAGGVIAQGLGWVGWFGD